MFEEDIAQAEGLNQHWLKESIFALKQELVSIKLKVMVDMGVKGTIKN